MPIIHRPTVLILGAGASFPYGYPLGSELVDQCVQLTKAAGEERVILQATGCKPEELVKIQTGLVDADPVSIDAYLEQQPKRTQEVGKRLIALALLRCERESKNMGLNPRRHYLRNRGDRRTEDERDRWQDHWYQYLVHRLTNGVKYDEFQSHRLSIINFNYDRSLEAYLHQVLTAKYPDRDATPLLNHLSVIHVHGHLGPLSWEAVGRSYGDLGKGVRDAANLVGGAAASIRIVSDDIADRDAEFLKARQRLSEAHVVCFLGFGYHDVNLERLKVANLPARPFMFGTRKGMGRAEFEAVRRALGTPPLQPEFDIATDYGCLSFLRYENVLYDATK